MREENVRVIQLLLELQEEKSRENDKNMATMEQEERTKELNDKDAEINELKEKNYDLSAKYRQKVRELLDKDDKIDQLKRQIDNLQNLSVANKKLQSENADLKSSMKEKDIQIVELTKRLQDVQSGVEVRQEDNKSLKSEIAALKARVEEKDDEIINCKSLMRQNKDQIKRLQSEVLTKSDENAKVWFKNNDLKCHLKQKETDVVNLENKCKELERYIDENAVDLPLGATVQDGKIIMTEQVDEEMPEVESKEEYQTETEVIFLSSDEDEPCNSAELEEKHMLPESSQMLVSKELDQELMTKRSPVLNKFLQGIEEDDEQEQETELESESEAEPETNLEAEQEQVQIEVQKRKRVRNTPIRHNVSDEEINQINHYIFNVYKPLRPNPTFSRPYFRILSQKLKEDNVCDRSYVHLRDTFRQTRIYNLYKNKGLQTAEHREIAVKAFKSFGGKRAQKLIEQYDRARAPDITDEQIAQMRSLNKQICASTDPVEESTKSTKTEFSAEEMSKMINLMFNVIQVNEPKEREGLPFWKRFRDGMSNCRPKSYRRTCMVYKVHFRRHLLPTLHERDDLHTPEHRRIAIEMYSLWFELDLMEQHIHKYDTARHSRNNHS